MTRLALAGFFAAAALGVTAVFTTATDAHPPEPTEATELIGHDAFLTAPNGWQTYVNGRFGTRISYPPEIFTPAEAPETGDGRRFEGTDAVLE
jgi:hypothetical protein